MSNPWNEYAALYDKAQGETGDAAHQFLFDPSISQVLGDVTGKTILDAGCGNGYWTRRLAKTAARVVGIDESSELLELAKKKDNPKNVEFRLMDLEKKLDFENETFDIVLSSMVLHFIGSLDTTTREFSRILKPGGKVVICVQHPMYQYHFRVLETAGKKSDIFFDTVGYFDRQKTRQKTLAGNAIVDTYNRPLEDYIHRFLENNFVLTDFKEPGYADELLEKYPRYKESKEVPRVVILGFTKNS